LIRRSKNGGKGQGRLKIRQGAFLSFKLDFLGPVVKLKEEDFNVKKREIKAKAKKPETITSGPYDCCWYEPPCDHLCCGGVCCGG
jgi:hypothetical protein